MSDGPEKVSTVGARVRVYQDNEKNGFVFINGMKRRFDELTDEERARCVVPVSTPVSVTSPELTDETLPLPGDDDSGPAHKLSPYKPEYCAMLRRHIDEGGTFRSFAEVLKLNRLTLYKWVRKNPSFARAKKEAESIATEKAREAKEAAASQVQPPVPVVPKKQASATKPERKGASAHSPESDTKKKPSRSRGRMRQVPDDEDEEPKKRDLPPVRAGSRSLYQEAFCDRLIMHMTDGLSFETFAAVAGCHRDTLYEWVKVHPEFAEAKMVGEARSLLYWEELGIQGATGRIYGFNPAAWVFNMKNRFKWTDRLEQEVSGKGGNAITLNVNSSEERRMVINETQEKIAQLKALLAEKRGRGSNRS